MNKSHRDIKGLVNPKMYRQLMAIRGDNDDMKFQFKYVDSPNWVVERKMEYEEVVNVCNDHSIEAVKVLFNHSEPLYIYPYK